MSSGFDHVMLVRDVIVHGSDSFNGNGFASGKLLWRSVKLLINDEAVLSSGEEVICLLFLSGEGHTLVFLHRIILSF